MHTALNGKTLGLLQKLRPPRGAAKFEGLQNTVRLTTWNETGGKPR
jgi:hypothetical protein